MYKAAGIEISRFPKQERDKMISDHAQAIWNSWKERNKDFGGYEFFDAWIEERDKTLERFPHGIYTERPLSLAVRKHLPKIQ
jgi:hypothetical protein